MNLLIGVTGGIAVYKAADLTSRALKAGWDVRVSMTPSATQFVGPLTFEGLTGEPVFTHVLATGADAEGSSAVRHISWARWPDVVILAPVTLASLSKLAMGLSDNALLTIVHALEPTVPVLVAPAMNTQMWEHPTTQRNLRWLDETGRYTIIAPTSKRLACGEVGVGGLAEVDTLMAAISKVAPAL